VEILIVVAVIILLLSILIVATSRAVQAAQSANTKSLMTAMNQALVQFKGDMGYYPPVLDAGRNLLGPPNISSANYSTLAQDWYSITSLPDYLIGYGPDQQDSADGLGIRTPGRDGVWGATIAGNGQLAARNAGGGSASAGVVLGPYLELKDDRLLASIDDSGMVRFPGEAGFDLTDADQSAVIVDYWGTPIRYYRRSYPAGSLGQSWRPVDRDGDGITEPVPTLADIVALRPYRIPEGTAIDGFCDANPNVSCPTGSGDGSTTYELSTAEFALHSAGPDRRLDPTVRFDDEDYNGDGVAGSNADNITEAGP
jgi:type II secretory pathway pseudopilin PulG